MRTPTTRRRTLLGLLAGCVVLAGIVPGRRLDSEVPRTRSGEATPGSVATVKGASPATSRDQGSALASIAAVPGAAPSNSLAPARVWTVEPGTDLATVTEALEQASDGDRIVVRPGTYAEPTLIVDKSVELVGEDRPVLDGQGERQIMTVVADGVSVSGFVFRNVGVSFVEDRSAIKVDEAMDCRIRDNRFEDAFFGIYLANSGGCRILDNELVAHGSRESQAGNGIHLWYSRDVTIRGNRIEGHRDGIYFEFVEDSRVSGNESRHNLRYGLHFMFSDRCWYQDNVFADNGAGVAVMYTHDIVMRSNVFDHNWGNASFGLLLKDITDSELRGNLFRRNSVGIVAEGSNRMTVSDNDFLENGWAVKIMANSQDNLFTRNNFVANSFDVATNSRRSYSTFEGNYWDAYRGYDLDRDGVGDVPFRPVRLFSLIVERNEPSLVLLRSFLVTLLDAAERVVPALTPETLVDERPSMKRFP
jgi:nitrous oxidase accessory protein